MTRKEGIVLRSIVYYTLDTVGLLLLSTMMLGTTSPSLWSCDSATCLPVISTGPDWLSKIGTDCAGRMSRVLGVLGAGSAWAF